MTDDLAAFLSGFHSAALWAYVEVAAESGAWPPDSEAVRRRAYDLFETEKRKDTTAMTNTRESDLLAALQAVLPYARNEAEGLEGYRGEDDVADEQADKAWKAVKQAEAAVGAA